MIDFCKYVDVFHGCDEIDLPAPQGVAATWKFIKGITGNTNPGAALPFGKYSCCTYTAGYPTGYGDHLPNSCPQDFRRSAECRKFLGLSHFQQSGTGAIDYYYNYCIISPFFGDPAAFNGTDIEDEYAQPGYYAVKTADGIYSETTVSTTSAYHRFRFPSENGVLAVDFTNDGLLKKSERDYARPESGLIRIVSPTEVYAEIVLSGLPTYFCLQLKNARAVSLLQNNRYIAGKEILFGKTEDTFGVLIEADGETVETRLSVSIKNATFAQADLAVDDGGFDDVRNAAYEKWNEALSRIAIETDDERQKNIFYSNLYHTLIKPCSRSGESPLWEDKAFCVDFATMWDIYKTQLPLVFSLYPGIAKEIVDTIILCGLHTGQLPHTFLLTKGCHVPSDQACMLAEHSLADACFRGIPADWKAALRAIVKDLKREHYADIIAGVIPNRLTHFLDVCEACAAVADIAESQNETALAGELRAFADTWTDAYDPATGYIYANHDYYEGNYRNYSFRLLRDMDKRIELAGGVEAFVKQLDNFFGFTEEDEHSGCFEGFNNESDMETPYAYHYAKRYDRLCEVLAAGEDSMFTTGRGGLPGNNDSGGTSSCHIWNCLGIFPVTGQNLMLIGFPKYEKTVLKLHNGNILTIEKQGKGIYTKSATLNGEDLPDLRFSVTDMMNGGVLCIVCEEE
ncbi:MAG: glycoside hydrolase family 92 protein [Ruminococcaceae bacterium]|nr:glycoside hydrolase family 92 protein [Oscillospiraceae bacterium]